MRLIDADAYTHEINNRIEAAIKWGTNAIADRNEEIRIRAEQAVATFCEASLTAKKMPTIEAEPIRHGEWIVDTIYPSGVKKFHCSVCGQERTVHEKYEGVFRQNYCPNCGAHMHKGET